MKIGIVLNSNDPETIWNAFRFGNNALDRKHVVKIFLLGKGVEAENAKDNRFPSLQAAINKFIKNKGAILACGTCLRTRGKEESRICPVSTMDGLFQLVEESDKVLTF